MSSIKVAVRCRPLFEQERSATGLDIQGKRILLDSKTYDPDYTFPPTSTQDDVFAACRPILQCVKDGLNGTLMVYGQTGTGKTYTMLGTDGADNGLVHKVIAHMLDHVQQKTLDGAQCALTLSMIEIYNEKLTDMLSESGDEEVTLIGGFPRSTCKVTLGRLADANEAVKRGLAVRHTAATMMNERSSRSHVVFIVDLEEFNAYTNETEVAHLFMVDLAGSESIKKSQASGSTAGEAGKINKSLLALKSVFLALSNTNEATRPAHVPYRDSRLTELLQDSIGGTARTLMIACISSVGRDIEETKSTLMYAVKARSIRNAANTEKEKLLIRLRSMEVENQRLRNRLQERVNERGGYYITKEEHERYEVMEAESKELRECVEKLVKDSQASDARKHISESQTKILQGLVDDKETELQGFKNMYHQALQQFERNASTLQRVVQGALGDVQRAMHQSAAQRHASLVHWKDHLLNLLTAPPADPTSSAAVVVVPMPALVAPPASLDAADNEEAPSPSLTTLPLPIPVSPQKSNRPVSTRGSLASQSGGASTHAHPAASSRNASPGRKGPRNVSSGGARRLQRDAGGALAAPVTSLRRALEEEAGEGSPLVSPGVGPTSAGSDGAALSLLATPPSTSFLQAADLACQAIVQRVNTAFLSLVQELMEAYERCDTATRQAAEAHASQTDSICDELRSSVEECIRKLKKTGSRASEDAESAKEELRSRFRVLSQQYPHDHTEGAVAPGPCDVRPLQHIVRDACVAVVRSGEPSFPTPDIPGDVQGGLDRVLMAYQSKVAALYGTALAPLATVAVQTPAGLQMHQATLTTRAQQQQQLSQDAAAVLAMDGPEVTYATSSALPQRLSQQTAPAQEVAVAASQGPCSMPPLAPTLSQGSSTYPGNSYLQGTNGGVASPLSRASFIGGGTGPGSPSGPNLPVPPSRAHSRTNSLTSAGSVPATHPPLHSSNHPPHNSNHGSSSGVSSHLHGKENRGTTGARLSNSAATANSARSSLRPQRSSAVNVSPRPQQKRPRSAPGGRSSGMPDSGRRTPSSRVEGPRK